MAEFVTVKSGQRVKRQRYQISSFTFASVASVFVQFVKWKMGEKPNSTTTTAAASRQILKWTIAALLVVSFANSEIQKGT